MNIVNILILLLVISIFSLTERVSGLSCWKCLRAKTKQQCMRKGRMVACFGYEPMCQVQLRHGGWGKQPLITKTCKKKRACQNNYLQNYRFSGGYHGFRRQCTGTPPVSVCTCCCSTDACNIRQWECKPEERECPALTHPNHGSVACRGGFKTSATCQFTCDHGYALVGNPGLYCNHLGKWDHTKPVCREIGCYPRLRAPKNGYMRCTYGIRLGSRCKFWCEEGYWLRGASTLQCILNMDGESCVWSRQQPVCRKIRCPPTFLPFNHGSYTCTDGNMLGSHCKMKCDSDQGYKLNPPVDVIKCNPNKKWSHSPCCTLPCPPFALLDVAILLDSSLSVGRQNFEIMKSFVAGFVRDFIVRDDATRFAVIRFNHGIDTATQILLHDYPNQRRGILDGLMEIEYDSEGGEETNIGKALSYTTDVIFNYKNGNRKEAANVVLLITDSVSRDDTILPSQRLRNMGTQLYVLPVGPPTKKFNAKAIRKIVESDNYILTEALERGFEAVNKLYSRQITDIFCSLPSCAIQFHNYAAVPR